MKIYVAHQISGLSYAEVFDYYTWAKLSFGEMGYEVLCPMTAKGFLRNQVEFKSHGYNNPVSTNHAIFERDKWMVTNCDVLYCDFTGSEHALVECLFELGWASMLGKHTVTVVPKGNIHEHAFVMEASDIIFKNACDAVNYLKYLIEGKIE